MNPEILILSEGYQDRAFWAGCLTEHFHCSIVRPRSLPGHLKHRDGSGVYHYTTSRGRFIHVYPCGQQPEELRRNSIELVLADKLRERADKRFEHILINPDVDDNTIKARHDALAGWLLQAGARPADLQDAAFQLDHGRASLFCWHVAQESVERLVASSTDRASIPEQQSLERLAATAFCSAYPGRGTNVRDFLERRVNPPASHAHKSFAMSLMAGWHADKGSEFFYQHLWQVPETRIVLLEILAQQPGWPHVAALAA